MSGASVCINCEGKWDEVVLQPRNVKTTHRKSCPTNLLQVSDLIVVPCIKVQLGHHIEGAFYLPYYCSLGFSWSDRLHLFSRIVDSSYVLSCGHDFKLAV